MMAAKHNFIGDPDFFRTHPWTSDQFDLDIHLFWDGSGLHVGDTPFMDEMYCSELFIISVQEQPLIPCAVRVWNWRDYYDVFMYLDQKLPEGI